MLSRLGKEKRRCEKMERRGTMGNNKKSRELRDAGKHKKRHYIGEEGRCRRQGEEVG